MRLSMNEYHILEDYIDDAETALCNLRNNLREAALGIGSLTPPDRTISRATREDPADREDYVEQVEDEE